MTPNYRLLLSRASWPIILWLALTLGLLGFAWYGHQAGLQNWQFFQQVVFFYLLDSILLFVSALHYPTIKLVMINYAVILELLIISFFLLRFLNVFQ